VISAPGGVTRLLHEFKEGQQEAEGRLIPLVYGELHGIAEAYLPHSACRIRRARRIKLALSECPWTRIAGKP
jgi:hypothetical protein